MNRDRKITRAALECYWKLLSNFINTVFNKLRWFMSEVPWRSKVSLQLIPKADVEDISNGSRAITIFPLYISYGWTAKAGQRGAPFLNKM